MWLPVRMSICTFEMELKEGAAADLLTAAKAWRNCRELRLAGRKAARGYWLAQGAPVPELPELFHSVDPQTRLADVGCPSDQTVAEPRRSPGCWMRTAHYRHCSKPFLCC